jgi:hypothetical protein
MAHIQLLSAATVAQDLAEVHHHPSAGDLQVKHQQVTFQQVRDQRVRDQQGI